jgi:hypothetical protein
LLLLLLLLPLLFFRSRSLHTHLQHAFVSLQYLRKVCSDLLPIQLQVLRIYLAHAVFVPLSNEAV